MLGPLITLVLTAAPTARLEYRVAPGLDGCPDEQWVRSAVSARIGRDPFDASGDNAVTVSLARGQAPALVATVEVIRPGGKIGRRTLESPTGDCLELASAIELAISLALDPSARKAAPADAGVTLPELPIVPIVTVPETKPPPPSSPPPPPSVAAFGVASLLVTAGAVPGVTAGVIVGGGIKASSFRLSLEGRLHLSTNVILGASVTSTFLALGSVVPCLDFGRVSGCLVVSAGPFQFDDGFERATTVMAHAGPRIGVRFEPTSLIALVPWVEGAVVLTRTSLIRSGMGLWVSWPVSISGGISLELNPS